MLSGLTLMMLVTVPSPWDFTIFGDSECETTPSAHYSGDGGEGCPENPTSHRIFEIDNMGNCIL